MTADTPLGFNPVGEHAPGLPRHDAPLPGHVPGSYTPMGDTGFGGGSFGSPGPTGALPFPPWFGVWFGRAVIAAATYLTLPIQLGLYPIAGIPALALGYIVYHTRLASGAGFDASMGSAWFSAWLALLFAMRYDTGFEERNPHYRTIRHVLRLVLLAIWMFYFDVVENSSPAGISLIVALLTAVIGHFILRSKWLRWIWDSLQHSAWLRKTMPSSPV